MGFRRIQHGTKKQLRRQVTYEDLEQRLVFQRMERQAVSKC